MFRWIAVSNKYLFFFVYRCKVQDIVISVEERLQSLQNISSIQTQTMMSFVPDRWYVQNNVEGHDSVEQMKEAVTAVLQNQMSVRAAAVEEMVDGGIAEE